jgi:REDY-like protein HapK
MSDQIIVLFELKQDADASEFEAFVRERDYAVVKRQPGVIDYQVVRVGRPLAGAQAPPAQYVEVLTVEDADRYEREQSDEFKRHLETWARFVGGYKGAVGVAV